MGGFDLEMCLALEKVIYLSDFGGPEKRKGNKNSRLFNSKPHKEKDKDRISPPSNQVSKEKLPILLYHYPS